MVKVTTALLVATFLLAGCAQGRPGGPVSPRPAAPSATAEPFAIPIIEMDGSPQQLGETHGRQLGGAIRGLFSDYFGRYFQSELQRNVALIAAMAFQRHLSAEHLAELRAMAGNVSLDERQVLLGQCFLDLSAMVACSTVSFPAAAAPDGVARFGRNLDFPSLNIADRQTVLLIFRPDGGRYAFASVAWPGMIGVLSGMNEHGLTLANMEVNRPRRLPVAMPYTLLYRTILERCRTVQEAIELLERTPRQTANNLMLMDAAGDRAAVEITPQAIHVRRAPATAALVSTNHQRGDDLDAPGRCPRFDLLHDAAAESFGGISTGHVQAMLARAAQGNKTLQSMVFEPSTRVIHLAIGANAPTRGYQRLDLRPLLSRNGR